MVAPGHALGEPERSLVRKSFALAVTVRMAFGLAAAALLWHWFVQPWQQLLSGTAVALVTAWWCVRALSAALLPLERDLLAVGSGKTDHQSEASFLELAPLRQAAAEAQRAADARVARSLEQRHELERMLDSMPEAVAAVDALGRLQWTNHAMRSLLPETLLSSTAAELHTQPGHPLVRLVRDPDVLAAVDEALASRSTLPERRARTVVPGLVFEVSAAAMPQGGAILVLRDVTPAERMERTQRDFVANVSHELRTPLTSITGYVQTLLEEIDTPGLSSSTAVPTSLQTEFLSIVLRNAERMNLLIDDLLELSRVESGEHRVHPITVPAEALIEETLAATAGLVSDQPGEGLVCGEISRRDVLADPNATVRVLTNLLENAFKYGRGARGTHVVISASVTLRAETPEGSSFSQPEMLCFSVRDFGPGIAREHQLRLFERFYRVDKARSRENGGTGLGLAIARGLVNAQGGEIWCESELGHGCDFRFTLPLAAEPSMPTAESAILTAGPSIPAAESSTTTAEPSSRTAEPSTTTAEPASMAAEKA